MVTMPSSRPRPKLKYSNRCTQIKTYSWDNAQVILVGNKCDMVTTRSGFETRPYFTLGLFNPFYANLTSFAPSWADRIILSFKKNQYCWSVAICSSPLNWQDKNRKKHRAEFEPMASWCWGVYLTSVLQLLPLLLQFYPDANWLYSFDMFLSFLCPPFKCYLYTSSPIQRALDVVTNFFPLSLSESCHICHPLWLV